MKQDDPSARNEKERLKALREDRKDILERNKERLKKQNHEVNLIKKELRNAPMTVPALSAATGLSSEKVLWYVMSLKKYGEILEGESTDRYFSYILAAKSSAKEEPEE